MKQTKHLKRFHLICLSMLLIFCTSLTVSAQEVYLVPGGELFGVELELDGVLVNDFAPFESANSEVCPARDAGLLPGDLICEAGGDRIADIRQFSGIVEESAGEKLGLRVLREGEFLDLTLFAQKSAEDERFHAGIWAKETVAGIGTQTYYDPKTHAFAGLGHGVCESASEMLLPIRCGTVSPARLENVVKGRVGAPGELRALFRQGQIATVEKNTACGVFGTMAENSSQKTPIPVATCEELKVGKAQILCTVCQGEPQYYEVEITEICDKTSETKNFLITVTDESLIECTGGIVQGMSGSPIIQDGKFVGALTHVLVKHPTRGYGIFIENMLKAAA